MSTMELICSKIIFWFDGYKLYFTKSSSRSHHDGMWRWRWLKLSHSLRCHDDQWWPGSVCGLLDRGWGTEPSSGPHLQSPAAMESPDPVSIVSTSTVRRTQDPGHKYSNQNRQAGAGDIITNMSHFHANKYQNCTLFSSSEICKIRHDIFNSPRVLWIQNV